MNPRTSQAFTQALVAATLVALALLGACGPPPGQNAELSTPGAAVPVRGIEVVDALGRATHFPKPPERIVVAGKSTLTVINTMYLFPEAAERIVGLVSGRQKPGTFLQYVDPAFEEKTLLEIDAGPEQIAPLKPDVVVMRSFMQNSLGDALDELDIPVVYVDLETPDQYFRDVDTLGRLFGDEARAEEILAYYRNRRDYVDKGMEQSEADQTPSVLLLQYSVQGGDAAFSVPASTWLQTSLVEMAGGLPVWKEAAQGGGWTVVNLEQVAAWDPDMVLLVSYGSDPEQVVRSFAADDKWQALRATKGGDLYAFPGDLYSWDQPDPRWILGLTWLAGTLHSDRFSDLDMEQVAVEFFEKMYGMDRGKIEASIISALRGSIQ